MLRLKCTKFYFLLGLRHRPRWGSLHRSPCPLAVFKGRTSQGRAGKREGRGREKEGLPCPNILAWNCPCLSNRVGRCERGMYNMMINAFLHRMYKYHFVSECFDIDSIVDRKFFKVLFSPVAQSTVCILYSLQSKVETTTFSSQCATILVASLLLYVVFFDLNRFSSK